MEARYTRPVIRLVAHPALHPVFEAAGYWLGYRVYRRARERAGDVVGEQQRWGVIAAAAVGGLVGSRALGLLEQAPRLHVTLAQAVMPGGGKTIVGGLLGGWLAVECVKWLQGIRTRTGDLFACRCVWGSRWAEWDACWRDWRTTRMGRRPGCRGAWTLAMGGAASDAGVRDSVSGFTGDSAAMDEQEAAPEWSGLSDVSGGVSGVAAAD